MPSATFRKVPIKTGTNRKGDTVMADLRDRSDLGTWGAFRTGWWVMHIVGIVVVGYIGYWLAKM